MYSKQTQPDMGDLERLVFIVAGALLLMGILKSSSHLRMMKLAGGGYLLYRGISGTDPLYPARNIHKEVDRFAVPHAVTINEPVEEVNTF